MYITYPERGDYMNLSRLALTLFIALALVAAGCSKSSPTPDLAPQKVQELYLGDLKQVDSIEIRSGSTGELKTYSDREQTQQWLSSIANIVITPEADQEGSVGTLFSVYLFENKQLRLTFTNNSIRNVYYVSNNELLEAIKSLFEDAGS